MALILYRLLEDQAIYTDSTSKHFMFNTHCYRNPPHDLHVWARSGISFFRSPVLRVPYTKFIGTFNFLTKVTLFSQ